MARMAVNAVCVTCSKDETKSLDSNFGLESNHRNILRLHGEQLSSRSFMRPGVAKVLSGSIWLRYISEGWGLDIHSGVFLPSLPLESLRRDSEGHTQGQARGELDPCVAKIVFWHSEIQA